jgi:putative lipoprotein
MKKILYLLALLPSLPLANEAVTYTCDDGSKILAKFTKNDEGRPLATLDIGGTPRQLALIPAASGAHFRGEGFNFYSQGDDAILEDSDTTLRRCKVGETPPSHTPAATSSFVDISGRITYRQRLALPADAIVTIRVQDNGRTAGKALTLAEQTIELNGQQMPVDFNLIVDRDLIGKQTRLSLFARIDSHGKLLFISDKGYPVKLVDGKSHNEMILRQVTGRRR